MDDDMRRVAELRQGTVPHDILALTQRMGSPGPSAAFLELLGLVSK